MTGDSTLPPPAPGVQQREDPLADLMADGEFPSATPGQSASAPALEPILRTVLPRRRRRRTILVLLALDLVALVAVSTWPFPPPAPRVDGPRRTDDLAVRDQFAVHDQGLVEQALAQAAAGRFDAAIADLELHLATHRFLGATERQLVNRALAIFATRAGRDAGAFEKGLAGQGAVQALLARAIEAERTGRPDAMRTALAAIVGRGDAPPSALAKAAELLLRSGDGTPLETNGADAEGR